MGIKYEGKELALFVFESLMAVVYLAVGIILLFTSLYPPINGVLRTVLGILFAVYGVFRVYRAVRKLL
ncbi:MAG: hypothetical protein LBR13_03240 [Dysgonamonadaceae bacterium]|jgi:hypothetical protein|nr:hypothetical protein [Dysgonamonadaceae bacterium]